MVSPKLLWLQQHGLSFDPFEALQADRDARLWMYWVGNPGVFELAWEPKPSIFLAPQGGGKSALRVRLTQECWAPPIEQRPFPLVYLPSAFHSDFRAHLQEIVAHGAREVLLALARYPRRFLEASPRLQKEFATFLGQALPMVNFLLEQMSEEVSLAPLNRPYDPGYDLEIPHEERREWLAFLFTLRGLISNSDQALVPAEPDSLWTDLLHWVEELLHRPSVYVLVDGLDAFPETAKFPQTLVSSIAAVLEKAPDWVAKRCYLKLFLPADAASYLTSSQLDVATITWSEPLLMDILKHRMLAASCGRLDALSALAEPALSDLDERLVRSLPQLLPRELLVLVNRVIEAHASHPSRFKSALVEEVVGAYTKEPVYGS